MAARRWIMLLFLPFSLSHSGFRSTIPSLLDKELILIAGKLWIWQRYGRGRLTDHGFNVITLGCASLWCGTQPLGIIMKSNYVMLSNASVEVPYFFLRRSRASLTEVRFFYLLSSSSIFRESSNPEFLWNFNLLTTSFKRPWLPK